MFTTSAYTCLPNFIKSDISLNECYNSGMAVIIRFTSSKACLQHRQLSAYQISSKSEYFILHQKVLYLWNCAILNFTAVFTTSSVPYLTSFVQLGEFDISRPCRTLPEHHHNITSIPPAYHHIDNTGTPPEHPRNNTGTSPEHGRNITETSP